MKDEMNRVAVITGGSSGIGLACAKLLSSAGFRIHIGSSSAKKLSLALAEFNDQSHGSVSGSQVDVRDQGSVDAFMNDAVDHQGTVDVLVTAAGISGGAPTSKVPENLWIDIIDVNLNGTFRTIKAAIEVGRLTESSRGGRIITIASTSGKQGIAYGAPYSASKHGVIGLTKSLAKELAPSATTVNAVCPGYVQTPMADAIVQRHADFWQVTPATVRENFEKKIPLGRYSTVEEVASMVAYLTTPGAASVTAQALNVCGGLGNY